MLVSLLIRLLINVDIIGVVEKVAHIKSGFIHMSCKNITQNLERF
jgi:hypothetical protein